MIDFPNDPNNLPEEKSKSQIKREMEALQAIGLRLTALNHQQLEQVPMGDVLEAAIKEYQRLKKGEAKRRQMQYIGRIMRNIDDDNIAAIDAIKHAINYFDASHVEHTQRFHQIESWRDQLLTKKTALTDYLNQYPDADMQRLRQLIRNAQKEQSQQKNVGSTRKLFHYLREISEATNE
jgi:ribosome-associated protein